MALAVDMVDVRRPGHDALIAEVLERGRRHETLARALLQQPDAAEWFAPLDPQRQVWVSAQGLPPDADRFVPPSGPVDGWDCHAQKPREGFYTSTLVDDVASVLAAIDLRVPNFDYRLPSAWWRIGCDAAARVYEVDGPSAWHALCIRYPALCEDGRTVPDWAAVAEDWDGVHVCLGGLLTAEQVRVESPQGWSRHWGWHAEQTVWLRWKCVTAERLPDRDRRQAPAELNRLWLAGEGRRWADGTSRGSLPTPPGR